MTQKPLYRSLDANLALLEEMFGRSDDFYTKRLMLAGIPCAIVMFTGLSSPEKLCHIALDMLDRDPHLQARGYYQYLDHPETGRSAYDILAARFSKTPVFHAAPAPLFGEHTFDVCERVLGMSVDDITELLAEGILA